MVGLAVFILGCVLSSKGSIKNDKGSEYNLKPSEDFNLASTGCNITAVVGKVSLEEYKCPLSEMGNTQTDRRGDCKVEKAWHCTDYYSYAFTVNSDASPKDLLRERVIADLRPALGKCYLTNPNAHYIVGQNVNCWEPVDPPVSKYYSCENQRCIKIVSPETEADTAEQLGDATVVGWVIVGSMLTFFGCCAVCCSGWRLGCGAVLGCDKD